ncbi:hypothetical protein RN001_004391 [Aquatica leii]|uniref:Carboxylic ester hydrolase n=1 Tax=Aquatica leii TaxID=1421715 RepID=A0AAN7SHG1_9COLE|nr:hypothetical protein RN001_004391 [Aquatica leii]
MFFLFVICLVNIVNSNPIINLPFGKLEGHVLKTYNKKEFLAFEGIPYAKPPIGELRFEEPQIFEPWDGILLANKIYVCKQYNHYTPLGEDFVTGNEDCLYLNVYTPDHNQEALRDVIVYIHGGAFMFGNGGSYGPFLLLDKNVVYVTINYRLGPLGFLSTEDAVVPGNNGLKDQLLALKWIRNNIKYFGGNPSSVTLTGMSAGGASAQLHTLSPLSKGLFHRGISQSGCVLNPWVLVERSLEKSQTLAASLNCPTNNTMDMIKCLKGKPAYDIVKSVKLFMPWLYNPFTPFGVVIDKWSSEPFLSEHPYLLLSKGKVLDVPWLFSHVESEGLYPGSEFISKSEYLPQINDRWNELIPHILDFNSTVPLGQQSQVLQKIRDFYFGNTPVTEETYSNLIKMISDRLFLYDLNHAVKLHSAAIQSPVYHYYFTYRGAHSKSETLSKSMKNFGVSHADDTIYVLSTNINTRSTPADKDMSAVFIDLWISYASNSIPQVNDTLWLPVQKEKVSNSINSLKIESPYSQKMIELSFGNSQFWDSLPFNENQNLYNKKAEL